MAGIASSAVADGGPTYEAEVDGVTKVLTIGMEVAQGSLLSDGNCDFPTPLVITGNPTEEKNSGKVTFKSHRRLYVGCFRFGVAPSSQ